MLEKTKKITNIIISISFIFRSLNLYAFNISSSRNFGVQDEFRQSNISEDKIEWGKPREMLDIVPHKPIAARDKYGNRLYYTPSGKMTLKIYNDGKQEFYLTNQSKEIDKNGNLLSSSKAEGDNTKIVIRNEKGEVMGCQQLGYGGKVVKEFDEKGDLKKTYNYNKYYKSVECIIDELSQTRTVYDSNNNPIKDIDFEGNEIAWYTQDKAGRLMQKKDIYGNVTYFDKKGNMTETYDSDGNLRVKYKYDYDEKRNYFLVSVTDIGTQDVTVYENGRQQYTKNYLGYIYREYVWDGTKLVYSFDKFKNEVTYYDVNNRPLYTTKDDILVAKWLYFKGRVVGMWDQSNNETLVFNYERESVKVLTSNKPPEDKEIQNLIDGGVLDKIDDMLVQKWLYYKGAKIGVWDQSNQTVVLFRDGKEKITIYNQTEYPVKQDIIRWVEKEKLLSQIK